MTRWYRLSFAFSMTVLLLLTGGCSAPAPNTPAPAPPPSNPLVAEAPHPAVAAPLVKGKPVEYETDETQAVHVIDGPGDWEEETRVRLSGAVWTFKPNGRFVFAPGMSREDLFPINGQYFREGSRYVFEGDRTVETERMETGHAEVTGALDFSGPKLLVKMRVTTQIGDGRVREDDPSSVANRFSYEATVLVKKAP